ncbi:MAG: bifunctional nuclease family protein [Spirochaetia bacterium]
MTELRIKGIALSRDSQTPFILLQSADGQHVVPITVGPFEASAILVEMEGVKPPRPLTHDLLAQFIQQHKFRLESMEVYGLLEGKHLSRIHYKRGLRRYTMEVRPSDGIALAVRLNARMLISDDLLRSDLYDLSILDNFDPYSTEVLYLDSAQANQSFM